jgi:hypothetical protein
MRTESLLAAATGVVFGAVVLVVPLLFRIDAMVLQIYDKHCHGGEEGGEGHPEGDGTEGISVGRGGIHLGLVGLHINNIVLL